jgi:hypothetical protein
MILLLFGLKSKFTKEINKIDKFFYICTIDYKSILPGSFMGLRVAVPCLGERRKGKGEREKEKGKR